MESTTLMHIKTTHIWSCRILIVLGTIGWALTFFLDTPGLLMLLTGIYCKGAYRYIWSEKGLDIPRGIIVITLLSLFLGYFVIVEILNPSLTGPMMWSIMDRPIDFPSMWFGCWRLWWIGMLLEPALFLSIIILYVIILIRWIYGIIQKKGQTKNISK